MKALLNHFHLETRLRRSLMFDRFKRLRKWLLPGDIYRGRAVMVIIG
jgi:hypothetical protein